LKQVEYGGMFIFRIEKGRIVETRENDDFLSLAQQVSPELKPQEAEKK
jgi:hypothetical protein